MAQSYVYTSFPLRLWSAISPVSRQYNASEVKPPDTPRHHQLHEVVGGMEREAAPILMVELNGQRGG
jgi:hypothetical protein